MKKILFIILVFCGFQMSAQKVKAEVIELDTLTTAERNALTVPTGKVQIVYDETIGDFYVNVKNGGWVTLSSLVGGSGDVTAASSFGTDNVLIRADGTGKGVQSSGISIDDSDNVTMAGDLVMGANRIFMSGGAFDHGDGGFYTGVDDGVSGQRWLISKDQSTDELSFGYQSVAGTSFSGSYPDLYTMNEAGNPTVSTDLVDIGFLQAGLDDLSGVIDASAFSGNLATTDDTLQEIADALDALSTGGGSSLPVDDTTSLVQDPVDGTKEMRIDVGAVSTATTRVLTMPDSDVDLGIMATTNTSQTLTNKTITLGGNLTLNGNNVTGTGNVDVDGYLQSAGVRVDNSSTTDIWRFLIENAESPDAYFYMYDGGIGGSIAASYSLNGTGTPSAVTDVTDVAYINSRIEDAAFGSGWNGDTSNAPSQNAVYDEMIKKLNSVTTGEPTGSDAISNIVSLTRAEFEAGTPVAGTYYVITDPVTPEIAQGMISDMTTDLTTGTSVGYWRAPEAGTITELNIYLLTAGTSTGITVDLNKNGSTVLSTKLTTDATENDSADATTAYVLSDDTFSEGDVFTWDIDAVPTGGKAAQWTIKYEY